MALQLGLPIGCLAATQDCSGGTVLAAGLSQFVGRYWTGEIVLASTSSTCDELVLLGKSSLRAGVAGLGWLPAQGGSTFLVSGSDDGRLDLWEYAAAEDAALVNLHSITAHDDIITDVAVSSSAAVASSSRDCSVRTWACAATDIQCAEQLNGHDQAVHCVAWGAEPATLLSGSQDATACAWDTRSGACSATLTAECAVHAVAPCPDSAHHVVVGDASGREYIFDLRRPACARLRTRVHADSVRRLAPLRSSGASLLASAGDDGQVALSSMSVSTSVPSWEPRECVRLAGGVYVHGLAWGPVIEDDRVARLFVGAWDGSLACSLVDLSV